MIVTVRNVWCVGLLAALVIISITETSAASYYVQFDENNYNANVSGDISVKGSAASDQEERKLIRVPLKRLYVHGRTSRSIDATATKDNDNDRNEHDGKLVQSTTVSYEKPSQASVISENELKPTKKKHKKLKLTQKKNSKTNERVGEHSMKKIKRHVDNTANKGQTVDDYYAQRKAVMERFYARQREINRKYQGNVSTTTESPQRYDLGLKLVENTVPSPERQNEPVNRNAITSGKNDLQSQTETRKASDNVKRPRMANTEDNDYDEYYDEDETTPLNVTPLGISITVSPVVDVHSWGQCNNPGLILFYEHHLRIHVHEASMAEADLTASAGESFCVACITTVPLTPTKAKISYKARHGNQREPKLVITGTRNEQLTFDVKFYAALKTNGHC